MVKAWANVGDERLVTGVVGSDGSWSYVGW